MKKLTIQKTFNASIDLVWSAFTTPEILEKWWSPEGMNSHGISVDLRKSGLFRFCFVDTNNSKFWGRGEYQDIQEPNFISYLDTFSDENGNSVPPSYYGIPGDDITPSLVEIKLSPVNGQTNMEMILDNYYEEEMTQQMLKGWNSMFDKLDKWIESQ